MKTLPTLLLALASACAGLPRSSAHPVTAGPAATPELTAEIAAVDAELFEAFFVTHDLDALARLVADDLEFVHDKHGLMPGGKEAFLAGAARNIELEAAGTNVRARRELVRGTLEVFPLDGYGAVELGHHRFFGVTPGEADTLRETGRFVHLWRATADGWQLARVVSYDHRPALE
jgi:ketosteroid isomerase-like protein